MRWKQLMMEEVAFPVGKKISNDIAIAVKKKRKSVYTFVYTE